MASLFGSPPRLCTCASHRARDFIIVLVSIFALAGAAGPAFAITASPQPYEVSQPDGTRLMLRIRGDEYFNYQQDLQGFTVIENRGWYVFARRDQATGRLVSSGLRAGIDDPAAAGLQPGELPSAAARAARARAVGAPASGAETSSTGPSAATATTGSLKNLVVLIKWKDHAEADRPAPSVGDIDVLMNNVGSHPTLAPTGGLRGIYLENSYGALSIDSTVYAWVTSDNTESFYAGNNSGLSTKILGALRHALGVLDQDPTFSFADFDADGDGQIDSITFLHSGFGAEWGGNDCFGTFYTNRIWSHKWSLAVTGAWTSSDGVTVSNYHISPALWWTCGSNIGRVGVIAHETGHFLGLPDQYDTNDGGQGIGSYGLMANSWGFDGSQYYPPHMSPWSKIKLGWMTPTVIDTAGTYSLPQAETSSNVYRIDLGYPTDEYLLVENRQPVGSDGDMPQGGLAIWHIDDNSSATHNTQGYPSPSGWVGLHYRNALLQADGAYGLEKGPFRGDAFDVWHAGGVSELTQSVAPSTGPFPNTDSYRNNNFVKTGNRIFDISAAGATMSFDFEVIGAPAGPPAAPSDLAAATVSDERIDLDWTDNADDETSYRVERSTNGTNFSEIAALGANAAAYSDTGLAAETTYWYQVRAANAAGDSSYSNTAFATTDPPPPPPAAPTGLGAIAVSHERIDLAWTDTSDETSYKVERSSNGTNFTQIAVLGVDAAAYSDTGLAAETTYWYRVRAANAAGNSAYSNTDSATTDLLPAYVDHVADLDIFVSGTVAGTFDDTHADDNVEQTVTERQSGGKPVNRYSFLEHQWRFSNVAAGMKTLFVNGRVPANSEGDDFAIEVSTDGGSSWTTVLTLVNGAPAGTFSMPLASETGGTIYARVVDTARSSGARNLDSVHIDQIFLRTDSALDENPPAAPTGLGAIAQSPNQVGLTWNDNADNELGFKILRSTNETDFGEIAIVPVDAEAFTDATAAPSTEYWYRVKAYTASKFAESGDVWVKTLDGISLSAAGSKTKGKIVVDLSWQGGAGMVDIRRSLNGGNFSIISTVDPNDGSYTDNTGLKGGQALRYRVCSGACSNTVDVVF